MLQLEFDAVVVKCAGAVTSNYAAVAAALAIGHPQPVLGGKTTLATFLVNLLTSGQFCPSLVIRRGRSASPSRVRFLVTGTGGLGDRVKSVFFLLRALASDGSGYPQSIPVDDSRLLYDVPTDDPEQSRPMPPGFILLAGVSCRRPIRVSGSGRTSD